MSKKKRPMSTRTRIIAIAAPMLTLGILCIKAQPTSPIAFLLPYIGLWITITAVIYLGFALLGKNPFRHTPDHNA